MQVAHQDESAASQGIEPGTLQQALPQVNAQLQPFLGQMLAAAYGAGHEQPPQAGLQMQATPGSAEHSTFAGSQQQQQ